jgi:hypothetical protein
MGFPHGLQVHHVVPLNGELRAYTIKNLPYNLRVYCPECHGQHRDDGNSILGLQIAEYLALDAQVAQENKGGGSARSEEEPS